MLKERKDVINMLARRVIDNNLELENILGITIKKSGNDGKLPVYNLYDKDGTLLIAREVEYWLVELLERVVQNSLKEICKQAEEDDDAAIKHAISVTQESKEYEEKKILDEQKDWETCSICGERHPKGTHYHVR